MKAYGGVNVWIKVSLTSALAGGERSALCSGHFVPGEKTPDTHQIGDWVGPRVGLDDVENRKFFILTGLQLRSLGHQTRSQSLYLLSYLGSSY
jgi:hypothetical protein